MVRFIFIDCRYNFEISFLAFLFTADYKSVFDMLIFKNTTIIVYKSSCIWKENIQNAHLFTTQHEFIYGNTKDDKDFMCIDTFFNDKKRCTFILFKFQIVWCVNCRAHTSIQNFSSFPLHEKMIYCVLTENKSFKRKLKKRLILNFHCLYSSTWASY